MNFDYLFSTFMFAFEFIFYTLIILAMLNYINRNLFFIKPMSKKYKIMASDLNNDIKNRYLIIFIFCIIILLYFYILFKFNIVIFAILLFLFFIFLYYQYSNYKKYDILEYINEFSEDLFDWYKIYELNISEDIKRSCFLIHNKNYERFKKLYILKLENDKQIINKKIKGLNDNEIK